MKYKMIYSNLKVTTITATDLDSNDAESEKVGFSNHKGLYKPAIVALDCESKQLLKGKACKYLLSSEDHTISLFQQKVMWSREEALANIAAVEIVELPISDRDQAIEREFDLKESE